MVCHSRRGSHGVKQVSISALVDQRTEPTILHFQEFTGLVKFNLFNVEFSLFEFEGR